MKRHDITTSALKRFVPNGGEEKPLFKNYAVN